MLPRLLVALVLVCLPVLGPAPATADAAALRAGLSAAYAGDGPGARAAEARITEALTRDIVTWARLRARDGGFAEYRDFLDRRSDWPGLPLLRARGEPSIPRDADPAAVRAFFGEARPTTGVGALRLAAALRATGDAAAADAVLIRAWTSLPMGVDERTAFLQRHGPLLQDHHEARIDALLWQGREDRAREMLALVPDGWAALVDARIALRERRDGVDALIDRVPDRLQDDPGLLYERFVWRMRSRLWDGAAEMVLRASTSAVALGRPEMWADRRAGLARDYARDGRFATAYSIAAAHFVDPDRDYRSVAELEWLAGYAALRLGRAQDAVVHFAAFRDAVFTPISMGRAGYWLGRAHEAAGNAAAAAEAYALGAEYQSSFYGQLAAERGGIATDPAFLGTEPFGDWAAAAFTDSSVFRAAMILREADLPDLSERFFTHLTESLSRREAGQLGVMALEFGDTHLALMIAKRAAQAGHEIMGPYYPIDPVAFEDLPAPTDLVLAIARRESEFDPDVVSGAGALGLMQVMPGTGRFTADRLGLDFSRARALEDGVYNARLGAEYLNYLTERFGTNPVLIAAAYNAGPSRATAWLDRFGDFRDGEVDVIDWIEAVPFTETRNYIMRVTESLRIYEAQLTGVVPERGLTDYLIQR